MTNTTPIQKPELLTTDQDTIVFAKHLEEDILLRPDAYKTILTIGETVTAEATESIDGDVIKRVRDYVGYKFYFDIEFDADTEQAIATDEAHQTLISTLRNDRNEETRTANRDKVAYSRLAKFVDRVIAFQAQESSTDAKQNLRSAS